MPRNRKHDAIHASKCAEARLWGMKHRAERSPPTAATGGFPYPARTCDLWINDCSPSVPRVKVRYDSDMDKSIGSAKLRDAILSMAA